MEAALARVSRHHPDNPSFESVEWIAIVMSEPDRQNEQRHLGVVFRSEDERTLSLLHLAWHHIVSSGKPGPDLRCVWVEPDLEPETRRVLSQVCAVVGAKYAGKKRSIKYALRYEDGRFDAHGEFVTDDGIGLTCATFVLALFQSNSVSLVRGAEWLTERDEERAKSDMAWQGHVVSELRKYLASRSNPDDIAELEAHIAVVAADNSPCARFRPEEVAAAGTSRDLPVGFAYAAPVGRAIVDKLRKRSSG